jgi:hypothetical protein
LLEHALGVAVRSGEVGAGGSGEESLLHVHTSVDGSADISVYRSKNGYRIRCFGCIAVEADGEGRSVTIDARPPATELDVADLLVSVVFPLVAQLQGRPAFHGSAVTIDGRAVGFVGPSGAGKSTLAALLSELGATLVADDTLLLRAEGDAVLIEPTASTVRLRNADELGFPEARGERRANGKLAVAYPNADRVMRIEHLYVLAGRGDQVRAERLRPRDGAIELAQYLFRIDPHNPSFLRRELGFLSAIAEHLPVSRLDYPRELGAAARVLDLVRNTLSAA